MIVSAKCAWHGSCGAGVLSFLHSQVHADIVIMMNFGQNVEWKLRPGASRLLKVAPASLADDQQAAVTAAPAAPATLAPAESIPQTQIPSAPAPVAGMPLAAAEIPAPAQVPLQAPAQTGPETAPASAPAPASPVQGVSAPLRNIPPQAAPAPAAMNYARSGFTGSHAVSDDQPPQRPDWHLRKKRADVYVDMQSECPFLSPMVEFLKGKGLSVLPLEPGCHYLAYEVILCDGARAPQEGRVGILDQGKGAVWALLKRNFSSKLS